jgi:chromosomal replication initiator protein
MKADQIWQAAQGELQLQMTRATYDTWVKPTTVMSYANGELVIGTPNGYTQEWWQNRLLTTVRRILVGIVGHNLEVRFVVVPRPADQHPPPTLLADEPSIDEPWSPDWRAAGIPPHFIERDLATLDWSQPALQDAVLRDYVDHLAEYLDAGLGLLLIGPNGIGKTHLVVGLAKRACEDQGYDIAFTTTKAFLARLRSSYEHGAGESEQAILTNLAEVDLLVLDDLRVDEINAWSRGKVFDLISRRYDADRPLLVTTNLSLNDLAYLPDGSSGLDEATLSRLIGLTQVVDLSGPDYRLIEKRQRVPALRARRSAEPAGIQAKRS